MGMYVNRGNDSFASARESRIYVDKTGLIEYTNDVLGTEQRYICNSRPRRFGKIYGSRDAGGVLRERIRFQRVV